MNEKWSPASQYEMDGFHRMWEAHNPIATSQIAAVMDRALMRAADMRSQVEFRGAYTIEKVAVGQHQPITFRVGEPLILAFHKVAAGYFDTLEDLGEHEAAVEILQRRRILPKQPNHTIFEQ